MNRFVFWIGAGACLFGLCMAMLGHDTPTQIRGLAEMIIGFKMVESI